MKKKLLNFLYYFIIIISLLQLIPVDRENPKVIKSENFVDIYKTPTHIQISLKKACYDCHSNETVYPDYAYVAPISWSINDHVKTGRKHLNFSTWSQFNPDLKKNMLENSIADIKQNRMPLPGYNAQHPDARLSDVEKKELVDYLQGIYDKEFGKKTVNQ